ncbi:MAG: cyclic nucleotide-binding domain-containing protein [Caldisericia bacterium]|nr:cyclic nucleotide-binding domain-containing protein [Caldisericia bacterium]
MFDQQLVKKYSKVFKAGSQIFSEGDFGREMYIILKGEVEIFRILDGKKSQLAVLKQGDIFGELAIIDKFPRSATAVALTDSVVLAVNSSAFESVILESKDFTKKIIKLLSTRIRRTNDIVLSIYKKDREDKIISALNSFYNIELAAKNIKIKGKIEKDSFLKYIETYKELNPKMVEQYLLDLKKQGKIDLDGNIITLIDIDRRQKQSE